jgi:hypothetical protein
MVKGRGGDIFNLPRSILDHGNVGWWIFVRSEAIEISGPVLEGSNYRRPSMTAGMQ